MKWSRVEVQFIDNMSPLFSSFFLTVILSIAAYSVFFMYLFGSRIIRKKISDYDDFLVLVVGSTTLALVVTLEAFIWIFIDRTIAGRFLFMFLPVSALAMSTSILGAGSDKDPYSEAMRAGRYNDKGLIVGNLLVILVNISCFFFDLPSAL